MHVSRWPEVGTARNIGCHHARGEVIAHWDDDDYSHPERLADQVARLQSSARMVTGYRSMRFTDGSKWWLYSGKDDYALGTSLCYTKAFWERNNFPPKQVGEDNDFTHRARTQGQIVSVDAGEMMYATVHPTNTSPRSLTGQQWTEITSNG